MAELVIHIGMPKTGSSSIQQTLFSLSRVSSYSYAQMGQANHGGVLKAAFLNKATASGSGRPQLKKRGEIILDKVRATGGNQIISSESLYHFNEAALRRIKDYFSQSFERIRIVGYVRPPVSFMCSSFVQLVKNHGLSSLDAKQLWPMYRRKLEKFDQVFGREHVTLRLFRPDVLMDGDVVQDFCWQLGAKVDPDVVQRVNESLSLEAVAVLFVYRKLGRHLEAVQEQARDNRILVDALSGFGARKLRFSESLVAPVIAEHLEDLEWIEERLGIPVRDHGVAREGAIACEQDLLDVAAASKKQLTELLLQRLSAVDPTSQQIANLMELLRIAASGRASDGEEMLRGDSTFFDRQTRQRLKSNRNKPVVVLRLLASSFARAGRSAEAEICRRAAREIRLDAHAVSDRLAAARGK